MRVAIVGSRTFNDYEKLRREVIKCNLDVFPVILTGDAKGTDSLAKLYANKCGLDLIVFKPINQYIKYKIYVNHKPFTIYDLLDNECYYTRNKQIVDNCDFLIAFWDGKSGGTKMTINYAKQQNKKIKIIKV
jgi:hypothetical protein